MPLKSKPYYLAASLVCADMLHLADEMENLEAGQIDFIHFDVMDGSFVPRYGLHPEMLQAVKKATKIPVAVHMMVQNPEPYIEIFAKVGADYFAVHVEACPHLHRTIHLIRQAGMKPGVALNPATSLSSLEYVLDDIDIIVLMAINPGIVGHKLIGSMMKKISQVKQLVKDRPNFLIQVDGGVTPESAPEMIQAGANMLVCGSSTIFRPQEAPVDQKITQLRQTINQVLKK